jgi:EAL domain-containing protein (putative c-di-GMP-specific phosphodiesterase class I)
MFGRRKIVPRVCIVSNKKYIREFLGETLEGLDLIVCRCAAIGELGGILDTQAPDVIILDLLSGGVEADEVLGTLGSRSFDGKVLPVGRRDAPLVAAARELGEQLCLAMLPTLATPFSNSDLHSSVSQFLPSKTPPNPPVDAAEALNAGWLELWYQPKFDAHTLALAGAEALIRMRHPTWGIVAPAYFLPDDGDPNLCAVSEFVISQAVADWRYFVSENHGVEIAINMPATCLEDANLIKNLCRHLPDHPAFEGLVIELSSSAVLGNLGRAQDAARQLRFHNVEISIDDVGEEWPSFVGFKAFPFAEIKVDQKFVTGCADDPLKRTVCRQILDLADGYHARTVAEGVETRADFLAAREIGFDVVQGFLFGKPMPARKFSRTMLTRREIMPP